MQELAGCVIIDKGRILLLHRTAKDRYELPGGKVDAGESFREAAEREIREELGTSPVTSEEIGSCVFSENGKEYRYHWFMASLKGSPEIMEKDKFDRFDYIPASELLNHKISPNVRSLCQKIKEGKPYMNLPS